MNTLVVLRPVRDPAGFTVNRKAQKIFSNRERFIVNPSDRNALEAALELVGTEGEVIVVALGGEPALDALRMARATGANLAIHIAVPENPVLDAFGITRVLRQVDRHVGGADLILLGDAVLDSDTAQVGARLAAALDRPYLDHAFRASALAEGGLELVLSSPGGFRLIGVGLPAVASIARDSNKPRLAPAKQIITVFSDPEAVETLTLADLGLDPADLAPATVTRGESFPPERTLGQIVEGEDAIHKFVEAISSS
jgi:electron transfer flavoprotein beta subunit